MFFDASLFNSYMDICLNGIRVGFLLGFFLKGDRMDLIDFNSDIFNLFMNVSITGIAAGFALGFISWGIGFAIYGITKLFKLA